MRFPFTSPKKDEPTPPSSTSPSKPKLTPEQYAAERLQAKHEILRQHNEREKLPKK